MSQSDAKTICDELRLLLPHVKSGCLRFWGEWFGRPMDNQHKIVQCDVHGDTLRIFFDQGETLTVHHPQGYTASALDFWIVDADRVLWEWYNYGEPQIPENLYHKDFVKQDGDVTATTNVDWYSPSLNPSTEERAVEIL
ncbi:MAG: hypothetical protein MI923_23055 [Phycisphaerales bacterium]|nr:hypothetical protein [Phycisphaerales bacterium]